MERYTGPNNTYIPPRESYCGGSNSATISTAWRTSSNVTPANSNVFSSILIKGDPLKEKFCCNPHSSYSTLAHTWSNQKSYSSN